MRQPSLCVRAAPTTPAWLSWNFACAIFVSAFLLFQVQPVISKYILPWFGGTPGVWTACMLFFQVVLFCGYCYAHLTQRYLPVRGQALLHAALLLGACILLPITPSASWKPIDGADPLPRILGLLVVTVGLPYFTLSSTGPLLQSWFSRAYPHRSPYRLYSLSNSGSLLGLITYPFLFEWNLDLPNQAKFWSIGFGLFALLCGGIAVWLDRVQPAAYSRPSGEKDTPDEPIGVLWLHRLGWVILPATASIMLLGTMNHISADLPPIPFLWVASLTVYLLSFVISFDHDRWYQRIPFGVAAIFLIIAVSGAERIPQLLDLDYLSTIPNLILLFSMLFVICMVCHGEVAKLRPSPKHLTEFFLLIAAGGAMGGLLVGWFAPNFFRRYWEWNIGLCLSFLTGVYVTWRGLGRVILLRFPPNSSGSANEYRIDPMIYGAIGVLGLIGINLFLAETEHNVPIFRDRNLYGVVSVREHRKDEPEMYHYSFRSGTIDHGKQFVDAKKRNTPVSYFAPNSGAGRAMLYFQERSPDQGIKVGVIGMGVGVLGAYARPSDRRQIFGQPIPDKPNYSGPADEFTFYEINPNVTNIAKKYFHFLEDMEARRAKYSIVENDGRIALEREESHQFQVLYVDAFTGDAPPLHLMTLESFKLYQKHLAPDGVICVNAINTYINIVPVLNAIRKELGWKMTRISTPNEIRKKLLYRTDFVLLVPNNSDFLENHPTILPDADYLEPEPPEPPAGKKSPYLFTDDYSNLFLLLKKK